MLTSTGQPLSYKIRRTCLYFLWGSLLYVPPIMIIYNNVTNDNDNECQDDSTTNIRPTIWFDSVVIHSLYESTMLVISWYSYHKKLNGCYWIFLFHDVVIGFVLCSIIMYYKILDHDDHCISQGRYAFYYVFDMVMMSLRMPVWMSLLHPTKNYDN